MTDNDELYRLASAKAYQAWGDITELAGFETQKEAFLAGYRMGFHPLAEVAKAALVSVYKVYSGFPSKLDWPELHELKRVLEGVKHDEDQGNSMSVRRTWHR